jgi:hypothetical protein
VQEPIQVEHLPPLWGRLSVLHVKERHVKDKDSSLLGVFKLRKKVLKHWPLTHSLWHCGAHLSAVLATENARQWQTL